MKTVKINENHQNHDFDGIKRWFWGQNQENPWFLAKTWCIPGVLEIPVEIPILNRPFFSGSGVFLTQPQDFMGFGGVWGCFWSLDVGFLIISRPGGILIDFGVFFDSLLALWARLDVDFLIIPHNLDFWPSRGYFWPDRDYGELSPWRFLAVAGVFFDSDFWWFWWFELWFRRWATGWCAIIIKSIDDRFKYHGHRHRTSLKSDLK